MLDFWDADFEAWWQATLPYLERCCFFRVDTTGRLECWGLIGWPR